MGCLASVPTGLLLYKYILKNAAELRVAAQHKGICKRSSADDSIQDGWGKGALKGVHVPSC